MELIIVEYLDPGGLLLTVFKKARLSFDIYLSNFGGRREAIDYNVAMSIDEDLGCD